MALTKTFIENSKCLFPINFRQLRENVYGNSDSFSVARHYTDDIHAVMNKLSKYKKFMLEIEKTPNQTTTRGRDWLPVV